MTSADLATSPTSGRARCRLAAPLRRCNRLLLVLTLGVLIHNLVWVVVQPAWQGPDEFSHYAYVERLAAEGSVMRFDSVAGRARNSAAAFRSFGSTGFNELRFRLPLRPFGAAANDHTRFPAETPDLSQHSSGSLGANSYPPAYYALAVPFFRLPWNHTATERIYWVRILSVLLGALIVPLCFLLAREVGLSERLSVLAAALATVLPIMTQQSAVFSPDVLLVVAITGLITGCVRAVRRPSRRSLAAIAAWGVLGALTKPIGFVAVTAVAFFLLVVSFGTTSRAVRVGLLAGVSVIGVIAGSLFGSKLFGFTVPATTSWVHRMQFGGEYLWQYYLPRPREMTRVTVPATPGSPPAFWMWGKEGVGVLGWLTTLLPEWTYRLAWIPTIGASALALVGGVFGRLRKRSEGTVVPGVLAACLAYILVLHASEAVVLLAFGERLLQGRYFLPVYPALAVCLMAGLSRIGDRFALIVGLGLFAAWSVVAVSGLNTILVYFG